MPNDHPHDGELLRRAVRGEEAAFAALYARYAPQLIGYFRARLGGGERASDFCQQVFLRLLESDAFDGGGADGRESIGPLLFTIARNLVAEDHRKHERRRRREKVFVANAPKTAVVAEPEIEADSIKDMLAELPPPQRLCLELRYLRGWTVAEIADSLDCAEGTVKSRIHYALRKLSARYPNLRHE